jgi:UPF0716 family protein affecting phage T7 exclusion
MIYFLIYLFLEVLVTVEIASVIGGLATFAVIILSALIGLGILRNFRETLMENMRAVSMQQIDLKQFQERNLFTLIGAILLIIPGFLSDMIGLLLQFSVFTQMIVTRYSATKPKPMNPYHNEKDDNVIDVEIISDSTTKS